MGAGAQGVRDALGVGDLICEFGREGGRSFVAEIAGAPGRTDLLLVYEGVTPESARVVSTQAPGRRPVRVRATAAAVHFLEPLGSSVRVTTLTGCERRRLRGGRLTCVRYTAQHAWHVGQHALADPDLAHAQLPAGAAAAAAGHCEPWHAE
jgi:hypothetical protein